VVDAAAVFVIPDDLARVVNAGGKGGNRGQGIVERGVFAAAIQEAVLDAADDDLAPPLYRKPCSTPALSQYSPTIWPLSLMPSGQLQRS